jgi:hypothetical protein
MVGWPGARHTVRLRGATGIEVWWTLILFGVVVPVWMIGALFLRDRFGEPAAEWLLGPRGPNRDGDAAVSE